MAARRFLVLGAKSLVGKEVLDLIAKRGDQAVALTRQTPSGDTDAIRWHPTTDLAVLAGSGTEFAICVAHIWVVGEYLAAMKAAGVRRMVALSTTSLFTKRGSSTSEELEASRLFEASETEVVRLCAEVGIGCTILRPTLIYGRGNDKNVAEIARMIVRFGFFPLFGKAEGKRQPIHARDVALAAIQAVQATEANGKAYNLSGGEVLSYRAMVQRIFLALGRKPVTPTIPLWLFRSALRILRMVPRFSKWTPDMAIRMNRDQAFDHSEATRDFGFEPAPFVLQASDVGIDG